MAAIVPVQFGVSMSLTVIAVAVGDIARDLDTGTDAASWTVTGAILASAVSTSLGGKLGDIYGHRRAFLASAVMLVVVTPLSGLAWNIESLIGFRVAAGVANGVATAAGTAMVLLAFPIATRSRAIGWYQSALSGAPAIGLIVGGQIVEQFGWRWVFAFFGVIAVIGLVTSATVVRPMGGGLDVSVDYWGGLTLTAGVALVLVGLTLLGNDGVGTSVSVILMAGGVVFLGAFARIEQRVPEPIISMAYLRKRNFSIPIWVVTLANFSFMGGLVVTPFLFTERLGWGLGAATLLLAVRPITFSSCAFAGGYIHPRLGARMTPVVGSSLLGGGHGVLRPIGLAGIAGLDGGGAVRGGHRPRHPAPVAHHHRLRRSGARGLRRGLGHAGNPHPSGRHHRHADHGHHDRHRHHRQLPGQLLPPRCRRRHRRRSPLPRHLPRIKGLHTG